MSLKHVYAYFFLITDFCRRLHFHRHHNSSYEYFHHSAHSFHRHSFRWYMVAVNGNFRSVGSGQWNIHFCYLFLFLILLLVG